MKISVLIIFVLINQYLYLCIKIGNEPQDIAEFQWKQDIELTWNTLNENKKKKYIILEVQGNPNVIEINKLDNNIRNLESKLEMLINEGISHQYHTTVSDIFLDKSIKFPGIPKGEEIIENTSKNLQNNLQTNQNNENNIATNQTGIKRGSVVLIVNPAYPINEKENIDGNVNIEVIINKAGRIANAKCISGNSKLFNSALSAISKWRFQPSTINNNQVNITKIITFTFKK